MALDCRATVIEYIVCRLKCIFGDGVVKYSTSTKLVLNACIANHDTVLRHEVYSDADGEARYRDVVEDGTSPPLPSGATLIAKVVVYPFSGLYDAMHEHEDDTNGFALIRTSIYTIMPDMTIQVASSKTFWNEYNMNELRKLTKAVYGSETHL